MNERKTEFKLIKTKITLLYMCEHKQSDIEKLVKILKSVFDNSDKYVHVNRDGYIENTIMLTDVTADIYHDNYDSTINNQLVYEMVGCLSVDEEGNYVTVFKYNRTHTVVMCQYPNITGDKIYFTFTVHNV